MGSFLSDFRNSSILTLFFGSNIKTTSFWFSFPFPRNDVVLFFCLHTTLLPYTRSSLVQCQGFATQPTILRVRRSGEWGDLESEARNQRGQGVTGTREVKRRWFTGEPGLAAESRSAQGIFRFSSLQILFSSDCRRSEFFVLLHCLRNLILTSFFIILHKLERA